MGLHGLRALRPYLPGRCAQAEPSWTGFVPLGVQGFLGFRGWGSWGLFRV